MYLNLMVLCITVGAVNVLGECVKDRFLLHEHFPRKEAHLKDVELIDGELRLKLDRKIEEKEFLEKTLAALKSYFLHEPEAHEKGEVHSLEKIYAPVVESHEEDKRETVLKTLKSVLGSDLKDEELTEKDLAAFELILKYIFKHSKKEGTEKIFKSKTEDPSVMHGAGHGYAVDKSAKMSEIFPDEGKDVETYLAESILHTGISKDANIHHGIEDGESLLKKLEKADGEIPYFLMDDEAKEYFKAVTEGKIGSAEIHSAVGADEETLKKISKILKDGVSHEEGSFLYSTDLTKEVGLEKSAEIAKVLEEHKGFQKEAVLNHGKDHVFDEILKKEEVHASDEGFEHKKIFEEGKAFEEHGSFNKDALDHAKDHMYDDILKKEEIHSFDEGLEEKKFLGADKSFEEHGGFHKESALNHAKDHIYDDILKKEEVHALGKDFDEEKFHEVAKGFEGHHVEKGIYASGEKVKAEETAAKKLTKDKEIARAGKDLSIEEILVGDGYYITGGTHAYEAARDKAHEDAEIPLVEGKEKAIDSSIAHGDEIFHKASEAGAEFAKGKEAVYHDIKGKEGILKEKAYGIDIGFEEDHIKHGIKTDETHLIHDEEHHKGDETLAKEVPHSKAQQIKHKLLSILGKILHIKKCHLVTMPPRELLGIVDCISRSKDPLLCEKFAMCEKKMPPQVILALEKCQKETIPGEAKRCSKYEPLYPSPEIPYKIFKCMAKNIHELTPPEKEMMIQFEACARQVKIESCGRIPWG